MIRFLSVQWFKRTGWRFVGTVPRKDKGIVLVVGPQSSWKDLLLCIAVKTITRFEADVMVSDTAWSWKSAPFLKAAGAVKWPDNNRMEVVDRITEKLRRGSRYAVAFSFNDLNTPDSEKHYDFYAIARSSSSSVVLVAVDHRHRVIKFHNGFFLSGIAERDKNYINGHFSSYYRYLDKHD